jgi:hypothetical protein
MDRSHKGFLTISDLTEYLWNHDSNCTEKDIYNMIWGACESRKLPYSALLSVILPRNNVALRDEAANRQPNTKRFSLSTSYAFTRVLEREISAAARIEIAKRCLILEADFSLDDAFAAIDTK